MAYSIIITKRAKKDIDRLDVVAKKRLKRALIKLLNDPIKQSKKLIDLKIGQYRFRVGDHRIIFDLDGNEIVILRVDHRREIYR